MTGVLGPLIIDADSDHHASEVRDRGLGHWQPDHDDLRRVRFVCVLFVQLSE
jgi:hypothetical protein